MLRLLAAVVMFFHSPAPKLDANLRYWQDVLGLREWRISVRLVSSSELDANTVGCIEPSGELKKAVIRILSEHEYDLPVRLARADQQLTVVHELVHLERFVKGDVGWRDEPPTVERTTSLVLEHRRWREATAIEGLSFRSQGESGR
jgi:hypothetical protein